LIHRDPANDLAVQQLVQRLQEENPRDAEILKLRFYEGFTIKQTAEELGISEGAVKTSRSVTMHWLRGQLEHRAVRPGINTSNLTRSAVSGNAAIRKNR
jgi:DNA-directed RNA polymerase specialized sigma24 family protein